MTETATAVGVGPRVEKLDDMRVPLKSWAWDPESAAMEQARNLARLPFTLHHVALMPDAHSGYGMPIGGVLFTDAVVIPYAVGVDIGCGVTLITLDMSASDLTPEDITHMLTEINKRVPVGNGPRAEHSEYAMAQHREEYAEGWRPIAPLEVTRLEDILAYAEKQLGTLGGGNHFVEIQRGDDGKVYVMIHSGSRSVGKKICDYHHAKAEALMKRWHAQLPDLKLAWLPWATPEAGEYWNDMSVALSWAEENRRRMTEGVLEAFALMGVGGDQQIDIHHNYASWENHFGKNGIVHRKGAVRARVTDTVLIPGSMGTLSYMAKGLGNPDSFQTCQHGAGRAMSRGAASRAMQGRDLEQDLNGTILVTPDRKGVVDEAPIAYKDIHAVMAASADLVTPVMAFHPLGVLKG